MHNPTFGPSTAPLHNRPERPADWADALVDFLFNPDGRVSRGQYWLGGFCFALINICLLVVMIRPWLAIMSGTPVATTPAEAWYSLGQSLTVLIASGLTLWCNSVLRIKRWHDLDKSGAWTMIVLIPVIGSLWQLVMCGFVAGTEGANRFGPPTR